MDVSEAAANATAHQKQGLLNSKRTPKGIKDYCVLIVGLTVAGAIVESVAGLDRPSNGDVEAFREYEAQIAQMIFRAFDVRGNAPRRVK